ncbi:hypothetical protein SAMN05518672_1032 [Chitinophaga sp. CF118]|uniref:hypothetical protein n=1 Tax=Chitinophaga sp. CF118 TaxID=1884367 RepID=UPI0008ED1674|nr:hypothetical protein [Chitinophaga sp. CF118]SFD73583.1 hypothetical protein SAMN05518672_1032 [Chitinophaga sp. CF118]
MAFQITYTRLAVVNMLHNFYLDKEGSAYYSLSQDDQQLRLTDLLSDNRYDLMNNILITPFPATEKILKGQKIVYRQTATGIVLGIASSPGPKPAIPINAELRLQFIIKLKQAALISRSNLRINPVFPACYYFTNDNITTGKTFPSLSASVKNFTDGRIYEMGEWAIVNGNVSQAITRTSTAATGWVTTNDVHGINEYDRILLPTKFSYTFEQAGITQATFKLMKGAVEIKNVSFNNADGLQNVTPDFTPAPDDVYTLVITGSNNYNRQYTVYLNNQLYQRDAWGVLDLVIQPANPAFQLIDAGGLLTSPAFELRFTSRATYWKYYLQKGDPPAVDLNWNDVLPVPPGMKKVIISKEPYTLMQAYRKVNYATISLPNPEGDLLSRQGDLICSEILLPKLKL